MRIIKLFSILILSLFIIGGCDTDGEDQASSCNCVSEDFITLDDCEFASISFTCLGFFSWDPNPPMPSLGECVVRDCVSPDVLDEGSCLDAAIPFENFTCFPHSD